MPTYRLTSVDGDNLGTVKLASVPWRVGDTIHQGSGDSFLVRAVVPAEDGDDVDGYVTVEQQP